jgi:hypothetical protein
MRAVLAFVCFGLGCQPTPGSEGPLGIPRVLDGQVHAGAAAIDLTPEILETFTDLNDDGTFDGCLDDPTASGEGCDEPFDDVNGDGWFDAVFIAGYGPMRPANGVHDPVWVRAVVLAQDGGYLAIVSGDFVGLSHARINPAALRLQVDGFSRDRLIVVSTHNHQGPDTMGLWGNPEDFANPVSGRDPAYQERVTAAIEQAVREAAAAMEPVDLVVAASHMRDRDPYFSSAAFGGRNPSTKMHGMVHDIRDPVVVSDQLLTIQGLRGPDDAVFTLSSWSGHPEVWGDGNNLISSDWVGVHRDILEDRYGGVAVHIPECLGGMQSAGGGMLPLVDEDGEHQFQACDDTAVADPHDVECYGQDPGSPRIDSEGDPVPEWAEDETWDFTRSHGWHIAEAAMDQLAVAEPMTLDTLRIEWETLYVPVENLGYQLLGPLGIFDVDLEDVIEDPALCPEAEEDDIGCLATRSFRATVGPVGLVGVPGELFPEIAWGLPSDDPQWVLEQDDPTARGAEGIYFPQHDHDCDALDWVQCTDTDEVDDCDCLAVHAWPYTISHDPDTPPLLDLLDTEYRAVVGMADNYLSYVVPEPDFNTSISLLTDDGDHYEDTVSPASSFGTRVQQAQQALDARW